MIRIAVVGNGNNWFVAFECNPKYRSMYVVRRL